MLDLKNIYDTLEDHYMDITKKYLSLSEHNLQEVMTQHPSVYAFFGGVNAYAKKEMDLASLLLETREAELREARREELKSLGQKVTDRSLDGYLKTLSELQALSAGVVKKSHKYHLSRNIMSSLDHQKDIIVQLSANKRAETKLIEQL